jgi:hypothetical protein
MKIINEAIFEKITQYVEGIKMFDGSNIEICVVNAFRKVALTYDEMFPGNDRDKLVVQAILTVLPQEWRDSCLQRVEEAIMHQLEGNKIPLEYLDRIRRIIDHLDRDSDSKLCGNICDVSTLIILYVSMIYTAGLVEKTGPEKSIGKLRRFCVLGM